MARRFAWFRAAPDPIASLEVEGTRALAVWRQLRASARDTGYTPIFVGDREDLAGHNEAIDKSTPESTASIIAAAEPSFDPVGWAREHLIAEARELGGEDGEYDDEYQQYLELLEREPETWPDEAGPMTALTIPTNISTGEPRSWVSLVLLPTQISWQAPAYLRFGNWNDCLPPQEHDTPDARMAAPFGDEVGGISRDVVEMTVERPPTTRAEATRLAVVQFAYCRDIVDQGAGTVEALAAALLDAPLWFFWWD